MSQIPTPPQSFDFSNLLPDWPTLQQLFGLLLEQDFSAFAAQLAHPKTLSAVFVVALAMVFVWFILRGVVWGGLRASRRVAYFQRLLRGVNAENLADKRSDLVQRAKAKGKLGSLWTEFDETLVQNKGRIQNSFDAAHFFNTHTLAPGVTESRLLAAVPGFLTAIGVIGTFMGLQLGLSGLDLSNTEQAQSGINQLVAGASVAFMTSVWGVTLSVLFNGIEKAAEQRVRRRIAGLQHRIDTLFPRANPEQMLVFIHDENRRATDTLDGLAEKIGHQMQQAMSEATGQMMKGVMQGLREVMEPAIKHLVESTKSVNRSQQQGSEKVLERLIERFGESFQRQGKQQRAALESAASELGDKLSDWSDSMGGFLDRLEEQHKAAEQSNANLMNATREHIEKQQQAVADSLREITTELAATQQAWAESREQGQKQLNAEMETAARKMTAAGERLSTQAADQVNAMQQQSATLVGKLADFSKHISESVDRHIKASAALLRQSAELNGKLGVVSETLDASSGTLKDGAADLKHASTGLGQLGDRLRQASDGLGTHLTTLTTDVDRLTNEQIKANTGLVQLQQQFTALGGKLQDAATAVSDASHAAVEQTAGLREDQHELQQAMQQHIKDLQQQTADFLSEYGQRVQGQTTERLNEWNKQTSEFSSTMAASVQVIADMVDEMDNRRPVAA